ncbi:MAG TPA: tyrosine phosphatase family protein [Bauldia sp.]|nr:tyrosine phosphatase family protein [Bauldia sp.]
MPAIYVCPLSQVAATVASTRASHLMSVINAATPVERPETIAEANHLFVGINDIVEAQDGMILPGEEHVRRVIEFAGTWSREQPMVVHCYAGISRSTAAAFITLCAVRPERDEREIAQRLRAASRVATPNPLLISLADRLLRRDGRMVAAIAEIGRGEDAVENVPFGLPLMVGAG